MIGSFRTYLEGGTGECQEALAAMEEMEVCIHFIFSILELFYKFILFLIKLTNKQIQQKKNIRFGTH